MTGDLHRSDVAVVGGGIIGLAVAWRAAAAGLVVTVCDPTPRRGASWVAAGMLAPVTELHYGEEELLALNLASAERWPSFAAELEEASGLPAGLDTGGTLLVAYDRDDREALTALVDYQLGLGLDVERLTSRQARRREPMLAPAIAAAASAGTDHRVDPRAATAALWAATERAGVRHVAERVVRIDTTTSNGHRVSSNSSGHRVSGNGSGQRIDTTTSNGNGQRIDTTTSSGHRVSSSGSGHRVSGVTTAGGAHVEAATVVVAAAWESPALLAALPDAPVVQVRPVKGQLLVLRNRSAGGRRADDDVTTSSRLAEHASTASTYPDHAPGTTSQSRGTTGSARGSAGEVLLRGSVRALVGGSSVYLVPRRDGRLVVGATVEEQGSDTCVTAGGVYELLRDASLVVPGISELELVEAIAGLRPATPDNAPVLGPSERGPAGLVLATGHHRNGILLSAITADLITAVLVDGTVPDLARPFSPDRFPETTRATGTGASNPATRPNAVTPANGGHDRRQHAPGVGDPTARR